jgi:hypothetical protein
MPTTKPATWLIRGLWVIVSLLALIGIAAAARRALLLLGILPPFNPPQAPPGFDADFAKYSMLTLTHVIPGLLFMILGPLQFVPWIRAHDLPWHRWSGRVFIAISLVIGLTALRMSWLMSIGGRLETAATTTFALIFLFALGKATWHILRREVALHREWMLRAFVIGLAVATIRPIIGMFFALSSLSPHQFFGIAFWIGFIAHLIAAEVWINYTRLRVAA